GMRDPSFEATVTLVCEHTADGALGLIVNRPTDLTLGEVLQELNRKPASPDLAGKRVIAGGPVARDRGFVVHGIPGEFDATIEVSDAIRVSFSLDIVDHLATASPNEPALFGLGYAGWDAGQLEAEMLSNAWLTAPSEPELIFELPFSERWHRAAALIGVDIDRLSPDAGHD
ncbi:MAG: YqgE/AlgH family protein, partial [Pseudomonadota bacterium]